MRKRIIQLFTSYAEQFGASVAQSPGYCVTMDVVTLTACSKSYLVGTIHYLDSQHSLRAATLVAYRLLESQTGEYLAESLETMLSHYDIPAKNLWAVTADGALNMSSAVTVLGRQRLHCVAYIINLVVQHSLVAAAALEVVVNKISAIVTFFEKSTTMRARLDTERERLGKNLSSWSKIASLVGTAPST